LKELPITLLSDNTFKRIAIINIRNNRYFHSIPICSIPHVAPGALQKAGKPDAFLLQNQISDYYPATPSEIP